MRMTVVDVRRVLLGAQGLLQRPTRVARKADVPTCVARMGALQIDTISVVARSPYFVLWSRLGTYEPRWLEEALTEGALFEYWSHAACFLPIEDYGLYRAVMRAGRPRAIAWLKSNEAVADAVLERVRAMGEIRSSEFERTGAKSSGWWDWKPEKLALECLFSDGELMIARREGFQRIYALRERVVPWWDDAQTPALADAYRQLMLKAVRALGVTKAAWVPDYFRTAKRGIVTALDALVSEGLLAHVDVDGWNEPGYMHIDTLPLARAVIAGRKKPQVTTLVTPFDPLVWDRNRNRELFGFDYTIEVYTPSHKRKYGYFTLPILHRDALVGRLDAKAHRKEGRFEVRALHLEPGVVVSDALVRELSETLIACAAWHKTPAVEVVMSLPPGVADAVRDTLATLPLNVDSGMNA